MKPQHINRKVVCRFRLPCFVNLGNHEDRVQSSSSISNNMMELKSWCRPTHYIYGRKWKIDSRSVGITKYTHTPVNLKTKNNPYTNAL